MADRRSRHEEEWSASGGDLGLLLAGTDAERGGRAARRRRHRAAKRRNPLGTLLSLLVVAALVVGIFYGGRAILAGFGDVPDYSGSGTGSVEIRINQGDPVSDIAQNLHEADVVKSARAFTDAAEDNPDSVNIQPGLYDMHKQMSGELALKRLLDPAARMVNKVVLPEGLTVAQTLDTISQATKISRADLDAAAADTANLGLPDWANGQLEGFLYPQTYEFDPQADALTILQKIVSSFTSATADLDIPGAAAQLNRSPLEIVTIASMIEKEAALDEERPMISRVIYNRLGQNIPLGIDATLVYELGKPGDQLTQAELDADSPYNTRKIVGLPPTAIASPGLPSLEAALAPTDGGWLYYVLIDAEGHHMFTADAAEFEAAKADCNAKGLGCGP